MESVVGASEAQGVQLAVLGQADEPFSNLEVVSAHDNPVVLDGCVGTVLGHQLSGPCVARRARPLAGRDGPPVPALHPEVTLAGGALRPGQASHDGPQPEVARQIGEEATKAQGLAGANAYLTSGQVRKDGAGRVDGVVPLEAREALATAGGPLRRHVEARLSGPSAAHRQPVPVEHDHLIGAEEDSVPPGSDAR